MVRSLHSSLIEDYVQQSTSLLREHGGRITEARLLALRILAESKVPLAALAIHEMICQRRPSHNVDKATVFRILQNFCELGLVHRVGPESQYIRCSHVECPSPAHGVLRCKSCSGFVEVHLPPKLIQNLHDQILKESGFAVERNHLELEGVCSKCRAM